MPNFPAESGFSDEFDQSFPGLSLSHLLDLTVHDPLQVTITALQAVHAAGGALDSAKLSRCGAQFNWRLKVVGLRSDQARVLSSRLATLPGVERASVEHQLVPR